MLAVDVVVVVFGVGVTAGVADVLGFEPASPAAKVCGTEPGVAGAPESDMLLGTELTAEAEPEAGTAGRTLSQLMLCPCVSVSLRVVPLRL